MSIFVVVLYLILIPCLFTKLSNRAMWAKCNRGQLEANKCGISDHYSKLDQYIPKTGVSYLWNIKLSL